MSSKEDDRFDKISSDPRFKKNSRRERKVHIDKRFRGMFEDERFQVKFSTDKRGRKSEYTSNENLQKFYDLSDSEPENDEVENSTKKEKTCLPEAENCGEKTPDTSSKGEGESDGSYVDIDIRGGGVVSSSSSESESESVSSQESDLWSTALDSANVERNANITRRLAVCNMDWDRVNAKDIFMMVNSFKPAGGAINSVKIYRSEFGKDRMAREDAEGPMGVIEQGKADRPGSSVNDEEDPAASKNELFQEKKTNVEKLRRYQLERLRYHYALLELDTCETADAIYQSCDGMEYESSGTQLDLRFVPESETFAQEDVVGECLGVPQETNYEPGLFVNTALQQSHVKLTWDETDPKRLAATMRKFNKDEIINLDLGHYLASESDTEEEDGEESGAEASSIVTRADDQASISKYRDLLKEIDAKSEQEAGPDLSVGWQTWNPEGKSNLSKMVKHKEETGKGEDTPWQRYLSKKKEKKKEKKASKKEESDKDEEETAEVHGIDMSDPYFAEELDKTRKRGRKASKIKEKEDKDKSLELLVMDEDTGKNHFNLKTIMKSENVKQRKKAKKMDLETKTDSFQIDVKDERFENLYTSHLYNIDPSNPRFKKTKAVDALLQEKMSRKSAKQNKVEEKKIERTELFKNSKNDTELSLLAKSLAAKAGSFQKKSKDAESYERIRKKLNVS